MSQFGKGYVDGWRAGCAIAFERVLSDVLYGQGAEYGVADCVALASIDEPSVGVVRTGADPYVVGRNLGESEGCRAAFEALPKFGFLRVQGHTFPEAACRERRSR